MKGDSFEILHQYGNDMNILFIKENKDLIEELEQYIRGLDAQAFFADSTDETQCILNCYRIDLVIIPLRALSNLDMLRYINDNFKDTKVVITVDRYEKSSSWKSRHGMYTNYDLLQKQLRLFELKKAIGSGMNYSPN